MNTEDSLIQRDTVIMVMLPNCAADLDIAVIRPNIMMEEDRPSNKEPVQVTVFFFEVAPYCLALPSFAFDCSFPDSFAEKLLLLTSKSSISQQSGIQMTSRFALMATPKRGKK